MTNSYLRYPSATQLRFISTRNSAVVDKLRNTLVQCNGMADLTRSSADADNGLDAFVGQSRSTYILGPFQVK